MEAAGGASSNPPSWPRRGPFFGRAADLDHVRSLIQARRRRLITVTGRGGVGKSAFALEVASAVHADGEREVVFVALQAVADPASVLDEVANVMAIRTPEHDTVDVLTRRLDRSPTLLILDNAEHLVEMGPSVNDLIGRSAEVIVVVTSQRRLGVVDECVVPLRPLEVTAANVTEPGAIAAAPAVALYLDRVRAVAGPGAVEPDLIATAELCRRLEGLPLAIELAAARAATTPAEVLVTQFDDMPLDVLRGGPPDSAARHRSVRAALAWTYELLPPTAQRLLRGVAVLRSPFDLDTVVAIAERSPGDVLDELSMLVDVHLVDPVGSGFFELAPSIRLFALEQTSATETDETIGRFVSWCASVTGRPSAQMADALRLALDSDRARDAHDLLDLAGPGWKRARTTREQRTLVDRLLASAADDIRPSSRGRALVWAVELDPPVASRRDREAIVELLAEAERIARSEGDDDLLLRTIGARLLQASAIGAVDDVDSVIDEAIATAAVLGDQQWIARGELWAGLMAQRSLDLDAAVAHGLTALHIARDLDDDRLLAYVAMLLGPLRELVPAIAREVPTLDEALQLVRRAGLHAAEAFILPMLVDDLVHERDSNAAVAPAIEALELSADMLDSPATTANLVVSMYVAQGLGHDVVAAHVHGAVADRLPGLLAALQPVRVERHEAAVDALHQSLGDRYDDEIRAGALMGRRDALEEALAVLRHHRPRVAATPHDASSVELTPRETAVLELLSQGMTNKEIGVVLALRPKTVMHHTSSIYRKLRVRGRSEAIVWVTRNTPGAPNLRP